MDAKTTGYLFLILGVAIMVLSAIFLIMGFTGVIHLSYFGNLFQNAAASQKNIDINSLAQSGSLNLSDFASSLNIIPAGVLDKTMNLTIHFLFMTFLAGFGYKLAMIGVNLIRPIVVKTGSETLKTQTSQ